MTLSSSYDAVADEYVRRIYDELRHKPLDRALLEKMAIEVRDVGPVCDLGCGPGQVARHLHEHGAKVTGIDLSPELVRQARMLNPGIEFRVADMAALPDSDGTWAGITAFYSLIHIPRERIAAVLREICRVLQPGGRLLIAFHIGNETLHLDEWWGRAVCVDFIFYQTAEMQRHLEDAGFVLMEVIERDPYPDIEHQSRRAYLLARKPAPAP